MIISEIFKGITFWDWNEFTYEEMKAMYFDYEKGLISQVTGPVNRAQVTSLFNLFNEAAKKATEVRYEKGKDTVEFKSATKEMIDIVRYLVQFYHIDYDDLELLTCNMHDGYYGYYYVKKLRENSPQDQQDWLAGELEKTKPLRDKIKNEYLSKLMKEE